MGWIIVFSVIALICVLLLVLDNHFDWDSTGVEGFGALFLIFSLMGIAGTVACVCDVKSESEIVLTEYQNLQEASTITVVPSEALLEDILDMNKKISEHKVRYNKFMSKGLYSEDIANLEYLPIPEPFLNVEIEYD